MFIPASLTSAVRVLYKTGRRRYYRGLEKWLTSFKKIILNIIFALILTVDFRNNIVCHSFFFCVDLANSVK